MAVFRVTDPAVLENPEIQAFVYRALAKNRFPPTTIGELAQRVGGDANLGVFIGHEGGKLGMAIAQLPTTHFALAPQVLLAYSEGPHSLTSAVIAAVKAWIEPDQPALRAHFHRHHHQFGLW